MVKSFRALGACALVLGACAANAAAILGPNTALMPGQSLTSGNGQYMLIMQGDGNLVFYRTSDWKARWNSRTQGLGGSAWMQGDGNFVVYATQGRAVWDARTSGHPGAYVAVQDDGNLVIYGSAGPLWWQTGVDTVPGDPESPGDVVGRESNDPVLQGVGNIGMFDGGYIVGVTNERGNAIRYERWPASSRVRRSGGRRLRTTPIICLKSATRRLATGPATSTIPMPGSPW